MNPFIIIWDFILRTKIISLIIIIVIGLFLIKIFTNTTKRFIINEKNQYEAKRRNTIVKLINNIKHFQKPY